MARQAREKGPVFDYYTVNIEKDVWQCMIITSEKADDDHERCGAEISRGSSRDSSKGKEDILFKYWYCTFS